MLANLSKQKIIDDAERMLENMKTAGIAESYFRKFDFLELKKILAKKPQYGANIDGDPDEDGTLFDETWQTAEKIEDQYFLKDYDFLIVRTGTTVGQSLLYKESMEKAIFAGYLIRFKLNTKEILPKFLFLYTKLTKYRELLEKTQITCAQPNINFQEYSELLIPLPDLKSQQEIVDTLDKQYLQNFKQLKFVKHQAKEVKKKIVEGLFE